jgi:hypothetical protein
VSELQTKLAKAEAELADFRSSSKIKETAKHMAKVNNGILPYGIPV